MYIEDALKLMRGTGTRMKRTHWDRVDWVCLVDPTIYPTVEGDLDEYTVVTQQAPGKPSSALLRLSGPFLTKAEATDWLHRETAAIGTLWDRYDRYNRLKALRADGPLDYAEKPRWTREQLETATISPSAKMSTKRLSMPYFAAMRKDNRMEVYTFTGEDFLESDWRTA
jgi:hypothetical protein